MSLLCGCFTLTSLTISVFFPFACARFKQELLQQGFNFLKSYDRVSLKKKDFFPVFNSLCVTEIFNTDCTSSFIVLHGERGS